MPSKNKKSGNKAHGGGADLRMVVAWRIQDERRKHFGDFGGAKNCAQALGITPSHLSHWEHGNRSPNEDQLKNIAKVFNVTSEYLQTPPKDWENICRQWNKGSKPKHGKWNSSDDESGKSQDASNHDAPQRPMEKAADDAPPPPRESPTSRIIMQMLEADKMHDRGEIPTQLFMFAMESINEQLAKLFKIAQKK